MHTDLTTFCRLLVPELPADFRALGSGDISPAHLRVIDRANVVGLAGAGVALSLGAAENHPAVFVNTAALTRVAMQAGEAPDWHHAKTAVHELAHHVEGGADLRCSVAGLALGMELSEGAQAAGHGPRWQRLALGLAYRAHDRAGIFIEPAASLLGLSLGGNVQQLRDADRLLTQRERFQQMQQTADALIVSNRSPLEQFNTGLEALRQNNQIPTSTRNREILRLTNQLEAQFPQPSSFAISGVTKGSIEDARQEAERQARATLAQNRDNPTDYLKQLIDAAREREANDDRRARDIVRAIEANRIDLGEAPD